MRPGSGAVLALSLLAGLAATGLARAEEPPQTCEVPAYLLSTESLLPKVTEAVKNGRPLTILVVGSRSSTIAASADSAYPAKLQAALKERLPSIPINLSVELQTGKTAEETDAVLATKQAEELRVQQAELDATDAPLLAWQEERREVGRKVQQSAQRTFAAMPERGRP